MVFVFLFLTSLHMNLSLHPCCCRWHYLVLLWLSSILLYIYTISSLSTHVDGHLGYFQILTVVSSAAVSIRVHVFFLSILLFQVYAQEWNCWIIW